jgi:hypothetical protein
MKVLLFGSALFFIAFIIHFIVWKLRLPKRQTKTMLQIFFITMTAGITGFRLMPGLINIFGISSPQTLPELLHIAQFFISLTLAYMITYSAIEADSPSLVMVLRIHRAGGTGLKKDIFEKEMSDELLIEPRVKDLLLDKMAFLDGNIYKLTTKGSLFAKIFIFYRRLLNAPMGG